MGEILTLAEMAGVRARLAAAGRRLVFTNGCFDILHVGHVRLLAQARRLGDALVVAVNSDQSVRRLKGPARPVNGERDRVEVLAALAAVDYVIVFTEDDPGPVIDCLVPDVLVKGGDWPIEKIVGRSTVEGRGGRVLSLPLTPGASTSTVLERLGRAAAAEAGEDGSAAE